MTPGTPVNVVALPKETGEWYVLLYDDRHVSHALQQLGRWASSDELSLSWYDAAKMSQQIRRRQQCGT